MQLNPSEEHIKSLFEDHDQAIDTELLWNDLKKRKKTKRRFFWILFGGFLLIAGLATIFMNSTKMNKPMENDASKVYTIEKWENQNIDKYPDEELKDEQVNNRTEPNINAKINSDFNREMNTIQENENDILTNNTKPNQTVDRIDLQDYDNKNDIAKRDEYHGKILKSDFQLTPIALNKAKSPKEKHFPSNPEAMQSQALNFEKLNLLSPSLLTFDRPVFQMTSDNIVQENDALMSKQGFFFEYRAGIGLGNKNLGAMDDKDDAYSLARDRAEELVSLWQNGILIGKRRNQLLYKVGINYRLHIEKMKFQGVTTTSISMQDTIAVIVDDNDEIQSVTIGRVEKNTTTNHDFVRENRIHSIGIPLEVGWIFEKNKWQIVPLLALEGSFILKRNGSYLNDDNSFLSFSEASSSADYSSKFLFQSGLRVDVSYSIQEHLSLGLSPYVARYLNSLTNGNSLLIERPLHYGLDFSLRYHLSN